jgi:hypothetical protein
VVGGPACIPTTLISITLPMQILLAIFGILAVGAWIGLLVVSSINLSPNYVFRTYTYLFVEIITLPVMLLVFATSEYSLSNLILLGILSVTDLYLLNRTVRSLVMKSREDNVKKTLSDFFDKLKREHRLPYSVETPPITGEEMTAIQNGKRVFRYIIMPAAILLPVILYATGTRVDYLIGYGIFIFLPFLIFVGMHFETSKMYSSGNREIIKGVIVDKYLIEERSSSSSRAVTTNEGHFNISGSRVFKAEGRYNKFTLGDVVEITLWGPGNPRYNRITKMKKTGRLLPSGPADLTEFR